MKIAFTLSLGFSVTISYSLSSFNLTLLWELMSEKTTWLNRAFASQTIQNSPDTLSGFQLPSYVTLSLCKYICSTIGFWFSVVLSSSRMFSENDTVVKSGLVPKKVISVAMFRKMFHCFQMDCDCGPRCLLRSKSTQNRQVDCNMSILHAASPRVLFCINLDIIMSSEEHTHLT